MGTNAPRGEGGEVAAQYSHKYDLVAVNEQPKQGPTTGSMSTSITTTSAKGSVMQDVQVWGYSVDDDSREDKETFLLKAKVSLQKARSKTLQGVRPGLGESPARLEISLSQNNSGPSKRLLLHAGSRS